MKGPSGEVTSPLELMPDTEYADSERSPNECGMIGCRRGFKPFGVVQTLEPAARLCRMDFRGPLNAKGDYNVSSASFGRNHRVDVKVEISEDGANWRPAGELKGLLYDAGFVPLEFAPALVKKIRITATAAPYHEAYGSGAPDPRAGPDYPHFTWRLIAPTGRTLP